MFSDNLKIYMHRIKLMVCYMKLKWRNYRYNYPDQKIQTEVIEEYLKFVITTVYEISPFGLIFSP